MSEINDESNSELFQLPKQIEMMRCNDPLISTAEPIRMYVSLVTSTQSRLRSARPTWYGGGKVLFKM